MGYRIKVYYETGNSFGREDTDVILELVNQNVDAAKENMQRIHNHYQMYKALNNWGRRDNRKAGEWSNNDWYVEDFPEYSIKLKTDSGNDLQIHCDWCGYFETLYSIELTNEEEFKIYI